MRKYLIYTDCHFSQHSSIIRSRGQKYSVRLHNLINSISWAEHLADQENCDEVLCLGDFFDRPDLNAEELTALQDVYFCDKPHTFLTGNHDANISSLDFSSVQIFKSIKAKVITDIVKEEVNDKVELYFIPYLTGDKLRPLSEIVSGDKKKVVLAHNDIAGLQYGKFTSQSGFNINDILNNCTLFLDGHLHNGYVINDRIFLIGNLTGQNFNEDATRYDHYAYIMTVNDDGSICLDPYVNPYAFNFYKIKIVQRKDIKQLNNLKTNAVVSVTCNSDLLVDVSNILKEKSNIIEYRLVSLYTGTTIVDDVVDFKVEDHLQQFIDYVQTKIQPSDILTEELTKLKSM